MTSVWLQASTTTIEFEAGDETQTIGYVGLSLPWLVHVCAESAAKGARLLEDMSFQCTSLNEECEVARVREECEDCK